MNQQQICDVDEAIPQRIFVGGLDMFITEEELCRVFKGMGTILSVNIIRNKPISGNYGFVTFKEPAAASLILSNTSSFYIRGKKLRISKAYLRQQARPAFNVYSVLYH